VPSRRKSLIGKTSKAVGNVNHAVVHFFGVEYTTVVKGWPHSRQHAFNRDVINPQDGHIL
jgi:hypothetical protein